MSTAVSRPQSYESLITEARRRNFPEVEMTNGKKYFVDANGLIHEHRIKLLDPPPADEVRAAEVWLATVTSARSRTTTAGCDSYALKHLIEESAGFYVSNGAAILALHRGGWMIKPLHDRSLNVLCNLSQRTVDWIREEQRKRSARNFWAA